MENPDTQNGIDMSALHKAHTMLSMLPPDKREDVLARMDPERADQLRSMGGFDSTEKTPAAMARQRQLMDDFQHKVSERRIAAVDEHNQVAEPQDIPPGSAPPMRVPPPAPAPSIGSPAPVAAPTRATPAPIDPLDELRHVHPVALARTMQGERAETWAIVLDRIDHGARAVIMGYLDAGSRTAIETAMRQRELLSPLARDLAEHAIRATVVPRALREHHILTLGRPAPAPAAAPAGTIATTPFAS